MDTLSATVEPLSAAAESAPWGLLGRILLAVLTVVL